MLDTSDQFKRQLIPLSGPYTGRENQAVSFTQPLQYVVKKSLLAPVFLPLRPPRLLLRLLRRHRPGPECGRRRLLSHPRQERGIHICGGWKDGTREGRLCGGAGARELQLLSVYDYGRNKGNKFVPLIMDLCILPFQTHTS